MMKIFTDGKRAIVTAAMFYAAALAVVLCCGCSDHDIPAAFDKDKQRVANVTVSKSTFTDTRDNKTYNAVKIGNQTWMAENLNYATDSSWCYNFESSNCNIYGRLYAWNAAKSACQGMGSGWHLPSREEWNTLVRYAGGGEAGKRLKSTSGWNDNGDGTDHFGFSALPGGIRNYSGGSFGNVGDYGGWWSATGNGAEYAYVRNMYYRNDVVGEGYYDRSSGFSVRCIQK